jgi:hypothetical protein
MTKREKVIIGLMLTVTIFGAYSFLSSSSENTAANSEKAINELNESIVALAGKINRNGRSSIEYILQKAEEKWKKDPFVQSHGSFDALEKEDDYKQVPAGPTSIVFSGFIHVGNKMIAIINGLEYEEGDVIGSGGLSVQKISREKVVLRSESGEYLEVFIEKY